MKYRSKTFLEYSDSFKNRFRCGLCNDNFAEGDVFNLNLDSIPTCNECLEKIKDEEKLER